MPISRERRRRKERTARSQITPLPRKPERFPNNILRALVNHPITGLLGLIAAILAIGASVWQAIIYPDIVADSNADPSLPFSSPFSVKNNSSIFLMKNTEFVCNIDHVRLNNGTTFLNFSLVDEKITNIDPQDAAGFRCVLSGTATQRNAFIVMPNQITSAHIYVWVKYQTLFIERQSPETEFTWFTNAKPARWIKGQIVD